MSSAPTTAPRSAWCGRWRTPSPPWRSAPTRTAGGAGSCAIRVWRASRASATTSELDHALALAESFEISREAALRRYVELQGECLAVVFSRDNRVRYVEKSVDFPATRMWSGDSLDNVLPRRISDRSLTTLDPVDPAIWLKWPARFSLFAQTLHQDGGFAATLLVAERDGELEANDRVR